MTRQRDDAMTDQRLPDALQSHLGKSVKYRDVLTPRLADTFRATFSPYLARCARDESVAPLGLHWCLVSNASSMSALGADGHPARDPLIPAMPGLPRRMWAGGELEFIAPLQLGDAVLRRSTLTDLVSKAGRSGPLCFATVRHEYSTNRGLALRERQDIVYRGVESPSGAAPAQPIISRQDADLSWTIPVSPMLLFRYSALTFNAHRIHYDQAYATEVEGHAGLVVHGPLQATLLLNLATSLSERLPRLFSYRGLSPLLAAASLTAKARRIDPDHLHCWTEDMAGQRCMQASVSW